MKLKELLDIKKDKVFYEVKFEINDILQALKICNPELLTKEVDIELFDDIEHRARKTLEYIIFNDMWLSELADSIENVIKKG